LFWGRSGFGPKNSNYKTFTNSPQLQRAKGARWNGAQTVREKNAKEMS
jgi:hypothetical protein